MQSISDNWYNKHSPKKHSKEHKNISDIASHKNQAKKNPYFLNNSPNSMSHKKHDWYVNGQQILTNI